MAVSRFLKNLSVVKGIKCHTDRRAGGGGRGCAGTRTGTHARAHAGTHAHARNASAHTGTRTQARAHIRTRTHAHACTQATQAHQGGRAHAMRRWGHQEAAGATITHQPRHRHHRHGLAPTSDRASGRHAAPWPASALDGPSWDRSPGQLADVLASALDGLSRRWPAPFQAAQGKRSGCGTGCGTHCHNRRSLRHKGFRPVVAVVAVVAGYGT